MDRKNLRQHVKPHIRFRRGRWEMDKWVDRRTLFPQIAVSMTGFAEAAAYFKWITEHEAFHG